MPSPIKGNSTLVMATLVILSLWPWYHLRQSLFSEESLSITFPTNTYATAGVRYLSALQNTQINAARLLFENLPEQQRIQADREVALWKEVVISQSQHVKGFMTHAMEMTQDPDAKVALKQLIQTVIAVESDLKAYHSDPQSYSRLARHAETVNKLTTIAIQDIHASDIYTYTNVIRDKTKAIKNSFDTVSAFLLIAVVALFFTSRSLARRSSSIAQQALEIAAAKRTSHARAVLIGMVSHELRTPLQTLDACLDLIRVQDNENLHCATLDRAQGSLALMSNELGILTQFAQLTTGDTQDVAHIVSVPSFLRNIIAPYQDRANQEGRAFTLPAVDDLVISVDETRLHQILDNFVSNALKYGTQGTIAVSCIIAASPNSPGKRSITFSVANEGPTITEKDQKLIWEPYYRIHDTSKKAPGTGLGLSVVRLLAETAGWEIGYERLPNGQNSFHVTLNIASA